jgi:hypothetical protein
MPTPAPAPVLPVDVVDPLVESEPPLPADASSSLPPESHAAMARRQHAPNQIHFVNEAMLTSYNDTASRKRGGKIRQLAASWCFVAQRASMGT